MCGPSLPMWEFLLVPIHYWVFPRLHPLPEKSHPKGKSDHFSLHEPTVHHTTRRELVILFLTHECAWLEPIVMNSNEKFRSHCNFPHQKQTNNLWEWEKEMWLLWPELLKWENDREHFLWKRRIFLSLFDYFRKWPSILWMTLLEDSQESEQIILLLFGKK